MTAESKLEVLRAVQGAGVAVKQSPLRVPTAIKTIARTIIFHSTDCLSSDKRLLEPAVELVRLTHLTCRSERGRIFMTEPRLDLPQGTLDLLILKTLALEPQHGWALSNRIRQVTSDVLLIQQGTLYPALHRLERRGWIRSRWGVSDNNRRARYYELTPKGSKQLEREMVNWQQLAAVVAQVLQTV
jgi:PadR family transcriptional regulator PadR